MLLIFGGLFAGLLHVLSGPDHLAAVAPLAVRQPRRAWLHGFRWGFGHSAGVIIVGILSLLLREVLPLEGLAAWSERLVGVMLVGIGLWSLRKAFQIHEHEHTHDDGAHHHIHMHGAKRVHDHSAHRRHTHAAFGIGTLHGLAGSSHFLAIIPALALGSTLQATTYLFAYGAGTIVAMMLFAHFIGAASTRFAGGARVYRGFMFACSGFAFAIGGTWMAGFSF
jgi:sulfite exporter TauE/SafE